MVKYGIITVVGDKMSLNKTKIEWCTRTWGLITGGCNRPYCDYCYARRIAHRFKGGKAFPNGFEYTFHKDRLDDPIKEKTPALIFADSMGDLFGEQVPVDDILYAFQIMVAAPQHIYQILTKNPARIHKVLYGKEGDYFLGGGDWLKHIWLGTSVDKAKSLERIGHLYTLRNSYAPWHIFASFEPLLERMPKKLLYDYIGYLDWIIIGQRTNPFNNPDPEWVYDIVDAADKFDIPVFVKNNLLDEGYYPMEYREMYQNYPKEMCKILERR